MSYSRCRYLLFTSVACLIFSQASAVFAQDAIVLPPVEEIESANPPSESLAEPEERSVDENIFFDAESLVPQSELGSKGGPKKVNPRLQPGSRFVIVNTDRKASSFDAGLVSAQRALKLGRYEAALDLFDGLYQRNKRDPNVLLGRAVSLQKTGQDERAVEAYEELIDLRPNNVEANVNMLGIIGQRFPAVALRRLMELRDGNRDNVGIAAQIAVMQAKLKQYQEAIRYLGIAASLEPQNASHIFNMAVIADKAGSKDQAIKFYEQALELDTLYGRGSSIPRETVFERLANLR